MTESPLGQVTYMSVFSSLCLCVQYLLNAHKHIQMGARVRVLSQVSHTYGGAHGSSPSREGGKGKQGGNGEVGITETHQNPPERKVCPYNIQEKARLVISICHIHPAPH